MVASNAGHQDGGIHKGRCAPIGSAVYRVLGSPVWFLTTSALLVHLLVYVYPKGGDLPAAEQVLLAHGGPPDCVDTQPRCSLTVEQVVCTCDLGYPFYLTDAGWSTKPDERRGLRPSQNCGDPATGTSPTFEVITEESVSIAYVNGERRMALRNNSGFEFVAVPTELAPYLNVANTLCVRAVNFTRCSDRVSVLILDEGMITMTAPPGRRDRPVRRLLTADFIFDYSFEWTKRNGWEQQNFYWIGDDVDDGNEPTHSWEGSFRDGPTYYGFDDSGYTIYSQTYEDVVYDFSVGFNPPSGSEVTYMNYGIKNRRTLSNTLEWSYDASQPVLTMDGAVTCSDLGSISGGITAANWFVGLGIPGTCSQPAWSPGCVLEDEAIICYFSLGRKATWSTTITFLTL